MSSDQTFSGTSPEGDIARALNAAVAAASRALDANFFTWHLAHIGGTVGGFVGAHDVTVVIEANHLVMAKEQLAEARVHQCGDWHAWHNRMPGSTPTLHVVGTCTFPTGGFSVALRPAEPQGINPSIRVLEKVVTTPTDPVTDVLTEVPVHYREVTSAVYSDVFIVPDNVTIAVQEVS